MAKYIDVDALVEKWQKELQKEPNKKNALACKVFKLFIERLKSEPAADVEPVRHGKWVICCDGYYPYCTECGKEPKSGDMTNYCPDCGAKMKRGGAE